MPKRVIRTARLYAVLLAAAYRAEGQYRANLVIMMLGGMAYQGVGLAFIWVVVDRFGALGGWTLAEVAFLYALRLTAHGLWVMPFSQLNAMDLLLRQGEFDRYLVRPIGPLLQVITRRAGLMQAGDLIGGLILLAYTTTLVSVDWSPAAIAFLILAIVGGALVELSVQLAITSLAFRLLSTRLIKINVDVVFGNFGSYPLTIFPSIARFVFTFVVPLAFVAYLPATALLERTPELSVAPWLAYVSPAIGALLYYLAYRVWRHQMRFYSSSGH